ncbi:hypothetical protein H6503_03260 [Candidatus Woesearchaeota archaeon]|nr:hypothetical protein [Candidatus Woesearchaeota archaeon]
MLNLIKKEATSSDKILAKLKNAEKRLDELENELIDLKYCFNEIHSPSGAAMEVASRHADGIQHDRTLDTKVSIKHASLMENHLKQARNFINTMIENDKQQIHDQIHQRETLLMEMIPKIDVETPSERSAHKFMDTLESEHLLEIFKSHPGPNKDLDNLSFEIGPDMKVRRVSQGHDAIKGTTAEEHRISTEKVDESTAFKHEKLKKLASKNKSIAPEGKEFYFSDGTRVSTVEELAKHLENSQEALFYSHVTPERNDFATWVKDVFHYKRLSGIMSIAKSKEELVKVLNSLS